MFGFVIAYSETLTPEEQARYRGAYCGLCRVLGKRHGPMGRLILNYDMTFLSILLSSMYEEGDEIAGELRCPAHPMHRRNYWSSSAMEYTADLSIALSYYHFLDDWEDDHSHRAYCAAKLLHGKHKKVEAQYPRACAAMKESMQALAAVEQAKTQGSDAAAACVGRMMGELFVYREHDHWASTLRAVGETLGRFVYFMDACMDLEEDKKRGRYNPLCGTESETNLELQTEQLTMLIGDCLVEFEKLPLVQDIGLLRNVLHSGVWQKYLVKRNRKAANTNSTDR